jgi:hypothetical protein
MSQVKLIMNFKDTYVFVGNVQLGNHDFFDTPVTGGTMA